MPASVLESLVRNRLTLAGVAVPDAVIHGVVSYLELLARWNVRVNLTAFELTPPSDRAIDRLIVEPLAAARHIHADDRRLVDVGSGGGSPSIPLKLAVPRLEMVLFESRTRKSAFLREAVRELGLAGTDVETMRLEATTLPRHLEGAADIVTLRAVRADAGLWKATRKLLKNGGRIFWFADLVEKPNTDIPPGLLVTSRHELASSSCLTILTWAGG